MAWFGGTTSAFRADTFQHMLGRALYLTVSAATVQVRRLDGQPVSLLNEAGDPITQVATDAYGYIPRFEIPDLPAEQHHVEVQVAGSQWKLLERTDSTVLNSADPLPTADAAHRGEVRFVQGAAGVADRLVVCRKNAAEAYAWVDLF